MGLLLEEVESLTNHGHVATVGVRGVLDVLRHVQRLGPLLLGGVGAVELEDLGLGVEDKHVGVCEGGAGKGDLQAKGKRERFVEDQR